MRTCLPWLEKQIDLIKPRVMVALGATAVEGLFGCDDLRKQSARPLAGFPRHPGNGYLSSCLPVAKPGGFGKTQGVGGYASGARATGKSITEKQRKFFTKSEGSVDAADLERLLLG